MPSIILPSRWERQPAYDVKLRPEIEELDTYFWLPGRPDRRLGGALTNSVKKVGRHGLYVGTDATFIVVPASIYSNGGMLLVCPKYTGTTYELGLLDLSNGYSSYDGVSFRWWEGWNDTVRLYHRTGDVVNAYADLGAGSDNCFVATGGPGGLRAYSSGVEKYKNDSVTTWSSNFSYPNNTGFIYINGNETGGTRHFTGHTVALALISRKQPSDAHAREISRNPYGELFVPHRRVLYFETAGGGTSQVTSDLADSYAIRAAVSQDCADSYAIRSAITQDLADSYALRALANGDLSDSYAIRGAVAQDLADAYDIQTSGVVTSDLADSYAIRAAVAQDVSDSYAIRAAVQASLADAYSVRAAVQASLADAYTIITATSADLDDVYVIRAQVAADMVDSYAVFASTGGGSCPSAAEIAAAVRTELAAELANMDAPVSGVPAAVWEHNLP